MIKLKEFSVAFPLLEKSKGFLGDTFTFLFAPGQEEVQRSACSCQIFSASIKNGGLAA